MTKSNFISDEWVPCPSGFISQSVRKHVSASETRRGFVYRIGGFGLTAIFAALGMRTAISKSVLKPDPMEFAISCRQAQEHMDDYVLRTITDTNLVLKIGKHLTEVKCSTCCLLFEQRKAVLSGRI